MHLDEAFGQCGGDAFSVAKPAPASDESSLSMMPFTLPESDLVNAMNFSMGVGQVEVSPVDLPFQPVLPAVEFLAAEL